VQFAVSGTDDGATYQLVKDHTTVVATLSGNGSAGTFSGVHTAGTYTARTAAGAFCAAAIGETLTVTQQAVPAVPTGASANVRCGGGTVTFSATVPAGVTIDWYTAANGGAVVSGGNGVTSFSPSLTATTTYYAQARSTAGCVSATRLAVTATVNDVPANPATVPATRCGPGTAVLMASSSGAVIDWYGASSGGTALLSGNNSYTTPSISANTAYYAQARNSSTGCPSAGRTVANVVINPLPTITHVSSSGNPYQEVPRGAAINTIQFTAANAASVTVSGSFPTGVTASWSNPACSISGTITTSAAVQTYPYTVTTVNNYSCTNESVTGVITVLPSCTFTLPPVLAKFQFFTSSMTSATATTLTDARDGRNYKVVKIGGRWIMAQNLNYQNGLTWQQYSNQPIVSGGDVKALIGSFWCPAESNPSRSSTKASCDVWGALYPWVTAMMVDGLWSNDIKTSSTWIEPSSSYSTLTNAGNTNNNARGTKPHGICPENWHVPTDAEWGELFNEAELSPSYKNHNMSMGWVGANIPASAVNRLKARCTGPVDTNDPSWLTLMDFSIMADETSFRLLPTGLRFASGENFGELGRITRLWSSSALSHDAVLIRVVYDGEWRAYRGQGDRQDGNPVRCILD
jgi:uncharacterized protein (TIGR02145 family)